jgi:hypothetical protein
MNSCGKGLSIKEMGHQGQFTGAAQIQVPAECLKICTRILIKSMFSCNAENENLMCF